MEQQLNNINNGSNNTSGESEPLLQNEEKLNNLRDMIDNMPREKLIELLANMAKSDTKPNLSQEESRKQMLRQKLEQAKFRRMPKQAQQIKKQQYMDKMKKQYGENENDNDNTEHEHCHGNCGHKH